MVMVFDLGGTLEAGPFQFALKKNLKPVALAGSGRSFNDADHFGKSVAAADGKVFVGAPRIFDVNYGPYGAYVGAVYVFDSDGNYITEMMAPTIQHNEGKIVLY